MFSFYIFSNLDGLNNVKHTPTLCFYFLLFIHISCILLHQDLVLNYVSINSTLQTVFQGTLCGCKVFIKRVWESLKYKGGKKCSS